MSTMTTPEQLPDESLTAYRALKTYCALKKRSIRRCARKLRKSPTICARWSKRYRWQKRLRELELEDCKRAIKADELAKFDVARKLEEERSEFQQRAIEASKRATERGLQILKQPLKGTRLVDAAKLLIAADAIGRAALELTPSGGGAYGLNPIAPPVITVIHETDELSKEIERIQNQFIADNPNDPAVLGLRNGHDDADRAE